MGFMGFMTVMLSAVLTVTTGDGEGLAPASGGRAENILCFA